MSLNFLDNLANLIFVSAYWVKDILWLRLLAIVGSLVTSALRKIAAAAIAEKLIRAVHGEC